MSTTIILAVDGSPDSERAVKWCADHAPALGGPVLVVHAIEIPVYPAYGNFGPAMLPPSLTEQQRDELRDEISRDWCKPLADAGLTFDVSLVDGSPASVIREVADEKDAAIVIVGRRGRGGFKELLLGSTTHQLTHHLGRPVVIVP